jgi:hypothetical protein
MRKANRILVVTVVVVFIAASSFVAPVLPTNGNPLQLAGFFPKYVSVSCMLFHVGLAYGPNSFLGGGWVLNPFCGLQ